MMDRSFITFNKREEIVLCVFVCLRFDSPKKTGGRANPSRKELVFFLLLSVVSAPCFVNVLPQYLIVVGEYKRKQVPPFYPFFFLSFLLSLLLGRERGT